MAAGTAGSFFPFLLPLPGLPLLFLPRAELGDGLFLDETSPGLLLPFRAEAAPPSSSISSTAIFLMPAVGFAFTLPRALLPPVAPRWLPEPLVLFEDWEAAAGAADEVDAGLPSASALASSTFSGAERSAFIWLKIFLLSARAPPSTPSFTPSAARDESWSELVSAASAAPFGCFLACFLLTLACFLAFCASRIDSCLSAGIERNETIPARDPSVATCAGAATGAAGAAEAPSAAAAAAAALGGSAPSAPVGSSVETLLACPSAD